MRSAGRVDVDPGCRGQTHQMPGGAGVVEVNMGDEEVGQTSRVVTGFSYPGQQVVQRGCRPGFDQGQLPVASQQIRSDRPRFAPVVMVQQKETGGQLLCQQGIPFNNWLISRESRTVGCQARL